MQLFKVIILVRFSIFAEWIEVPMGAFFSWNLSFLGLWFEFFELWLVCHCYHVPKPDMHNADVYQIESSILFLEYQQASDALHNFWFKVIMWCLKCKWLSNSTPRYLAQVIRLIFRPLRRKFFFSVIFFLGNQKITISILLTFKTIYLP